MCLLSVIDEAARHFENKNGSRPDILFLTEIGINSLWHDIHGSNPHRMAASEPLQDGDIVVGFTIRLDPDLPYGFYLSCSANENNKARGQPAFVKNRRRLFPVALIEVFDILLFPIYFLFCFRIELLGFLVSNIAVLLGSEKLECRQLQELCPGISLGLVF